MIGKILENDTYAYGFDAQTGEFGNLMTKGIIDPTKVVRIALQDGASIAGLLVTTEAMVAEKPKRRRPCPRCRLVVAWTTDIDRWTRQLGPDISPGLFLINVRRSYLALFRPPGAVMQRQSSPRKKGYD